MTRDFSQVALALAGLVRGSDSFSGKNTFVLHCKFLLFFSLTLPQILLDK